MSNSGTPPNGTDGSMDAVFSSTRSLLIAIGALMAAHGATNTGLYEVIQIAAGGIMVVGPAAWGVWNAIQKARTKKEAVSEAVTTAVNAGLNLAAAGKMLTNPDGTPVPATADSAKAIVQNFSR
jgi:hypothetical protein